MNSVLGSSFQCEKLQFRYKKNIEPIRDRGGVRGQIFSLSPSHCIAKWIFGEIGASFTSDDQFSAFEERLPFSSSRSIASVNVRFMCLCESEWMFVIRSFFAFHLFICDNISILFVTKLNSYAKKGARESENENFRIYNPRHLDFCVGMWIESPFSPLHSVVFRIAT